MLPWEVKLVDSVGVALVGFGYWGANLARNVLASPSTHLVGIVDAYETQRKIAQGSHPLTKVWETIDAALADEAVDAVILASPASTHADLASEALHAGKHVFVEKPMAESTQDAKALVELSASSGLTLMVGHTFLYSAPVAHLRGWIESGELGEIQYLHSRRLSLGRIRRDTNALWNFAPHDISIMLHLLNERPVEVSGCGFSFIDPDIEDVAFATMRFESGIGANLHVSWIDPLKTRTMIVVGDQKMAIYNDVSVDQPLALVDSGVARDRDLGAYLSMGDFQWRTRAGDIHIPRIQMTEPLLAEMTAFGHACLTGEAPLTDGQHGLDVVRILVAISESMTKSGVPIQVSW
jgi:predicted dehydrogenase